MHNGTRCALDGTAFPACRYQTQGVSRPSDVNFFPSTIWLFCHACCVNGTHARTHANKREKRKKNQQRFGYVHGMHSTTKSSSSVRHGLLQAGYLTDWLAAGRLGWAEVAQKEKNKRDSPIPQPRFCNTHPLHSRRHGAAQLPNPLCRRSLSQISEAFFQKCFFVVVCRRCRVTYLTYLTLPPRR